MYSEGSIIITRMVHDISLLHIYGVGPVIEWMYGEGFYIITTCMVHDMSLLHVWCRPIIVCMYGQGSFIVTLTCYTSVWFPLSSLLTWGSV